MRSLRGPHTRSAYGTIHRRTWPRLFELQSTDEGGRDHQRVYEAPYQYGARSEAANEQTVNAHRLTVSQNIVRFLKPANNPYRSGCLPAGGAVESRQDPGIQSNRPADPNRHTDVITKLKITGTNRSPEVSLAVSLTT